MDQQQEPHQRAGELASNLAIDDMRAEYAAAHVDKNGDPLPEMSVLFSNCVCFGCFCCRYDPASLEISYIKGDGIIPWMKLYLGARWVHGGTETGLAITADSTD